MSKPSEPASPASAQAPAPRRRTGWLAASAPNRWGGRGRTWWACLLAGAIAGVDGTSAPPAVDGVPAGPPEYTASDIGAPALAGTTVAVEGGVDVTGGGRTIGGTTDQFHFAWQERTGNFDVQARLADVTVSDPFLHAGWMARGSLEAAAPFAAVFASSPQLGCFFESRTATSSSSTTAGPRSGFPANYPYLWLRLQRAGNTFTGYASLDGQGWTVLGSATLTGSPSTLHLGFAVTSDNEKVTATARFRDVGTTASTATGPFRRTQEPIGPSSRTTGMVFSEIMYHPMPNAEGRNLEFIEVHNARSVFEDLTGWKIGGDVDFAFPAGFRLQAGETVVIAAAPDDLKTAYGITNVLGPFAGSLPNDRGRLRLLNNAEALRLEVEYADQAPWPVAADGAGPSLVLAFPSYGEGDVRAWAASSFRGGSPGFLDPTVPAPESPVLLNEFLAHTDDPVFDFIELYNRSNQRVDLSGFILTDRPEVARFRIPDGTFLEAGGFRAWDQHALGFALNAAGETLYLLNAPATRVLDAIRFGPQENGVASGRSPDGGPLVRRLAQPTSAAANAPWRVESVVIHELMYHPISGDSDDEFIELHNRTSEPIGLAGWRFTAGVDFTFPDHVTLPAQGYLVVARNAARLRAQYPHLTAENCVGDYTGSLSDRGERLALARPDFLVLTNDVGQVATNLVHSVVSELTYADGGRWGLWSDGGGSSLELIDPRADPRQPASWADSDETTKAAWTTIEFTGRVDNANGAANRLRITLLGAGECLVDDVQAFRVGSTNVVNNGDFENGTTGWLFSGNHSTATIESTGAASGSRCVHLRAQGDGDTGPNSLRNALRTALPANVEVTLRAKVRWLAGWPQVLLRLHGNGLELAGNLDVPTQLGTPGLPNSRRLANAGPAIYDVTHDPPLPAANEAVRFTCRVSDPDGVSQVQLRYRLDPATTLTTLTLRDDGTQGDEVAGDGLYSVLLPGRASGNLLAFRITATDAAATPASATFPAGRFTEAGTQGQEGLVRWGESVPFGTFAHYHLWFTQATRNARQNALDNTWRDGTLVYGNHRVVYNTGFRDKGSPYHGGSGDIAATTPRDEPLLGTFDRVFASTGNGGSEPTAIRSQLAAWYAQQLGLPYLHAHYMRLYFNGSLFRPEIMEDLEQPNHDYAERWFPADQEGDLYKIAVWFEFGDDNRNFNATSATLQRFTTTGSNFKLARYRWNWQRRSNDGDANNYAPFFDLVSAFNDTSANYVSRALQQADVEQWMRAFCFDYAMGNWDAWTYNVGQNMYLYRPYGQRWVLCPWDIDFVFGLGDGTSGALRGGGQDPTMSRAYANATFLRMNWRAYQDTINGPFLAANFQPQIDSRRSVLLKNAVTGLTAPSSITSWINSRRTSINSQLNNADAKTFEITSNGGADFESPTPTTTLTGTAPIAVATLEINGVPYPVNWVNVRTFNVTVPLTERTNLLTLVGRDRRGQPLPGATDAITVRYAGAIERVEDFVVINEVHYDAAPDQPASTFLELFNRSAVTPFDLSGFILQGLGYTFPVGTILAPRAYLLVVSDRVGFETVYGRNLPVVGEFTGALDNDGESLELIQPGVGGLPDRRVSDVRYWNRLPWPTVAAGLGPSLQLVDAAQGAWPVANWAAAATNATARTTPGAPNSLIQTLPPFPSLWLNEVQPHNVAGPLDGAGDRDPWIELYNPGPETVDLSALYLTDDYTQLTRWRFPANTTLEPGRFLVVWADGEPAEAKPGELHTPFRLEPTTGRVALTRLQGTPSTPAVFDYLEYTQLSAGRSVGSYPDGEPRQRRPFVAVTPGATNNPALPPVHVRINEIMAANTRTLADPADDDYDDWFELYNAGPTPVDLSGYTLTDDFNTPAKFTLPPGTVIPPTGILLVWADEETGQNAPDGDLHVNFKLSREGESIGLFDLNTLLVDGLTFEPQLDDVSVGRYPDGGEAPLYDMVVPTPRQPNYLEGGNRPPVFPAPPALAVAEGSLLQFTVTATDPDAGQTLRYRLSADAPPAATIDDATGGLTWTPAEADGPGRFSFLVIATDDGTPPRTASARMTIDVTEVNVPPVLTSIPDQTADEGTLFTLALTATDSDLPPNALVFSLDPDAPDGATVTEDGGFAWVPPETAGGRSFTVSVRVTDQGEPPLSDLRTFNLAVREVANPPAMPFIDPQFVNEGEVFNLPVVALDPDTPPSPLLFTLEDAPAEATIDRDTGRIAWPTTEHTGPTNAIFVVRATERNAPFDGTARTFSVTVREVNAPPTLTPVADRVVNEGTFLVIRNTATDTDLPPQRLLYSLAPGAPAEATIDPVSGTFVWPIGADAGPSTNLITLQVTDETEEPQTARQTFTVVVVAEPRIVINEIMYRAATSGAEYVELYNASARTAWDLAGWRLTGTSFTFPAGTRLVAGGYLVVARNRTAFLTAYGDVPAPAVLLGNFAPQLGADGGVIELYRPMAPAPDALVDRVVFRASLPWPTAANGGGSSLQLLDPNQDNVPVANWTAVVGSTTNLVQQVLPIDATWRYWQAAENPAPGWTEVDYHDTAWPSGKALLYVESAALPALPNTPLDLGQMSYFFRTTFPFSGNVTGASLILQTVLDDGAVFYLNGRPLFWLGMAEGEIPDRDTAATRTVGDAAYEGPFTLPVENLRSGDNVLAVEVHQTNPGSSDVVLGVRAEVSEVGRERYTPGYLNSVRTTLEPFPNLGINEVLALNQTGLRDNAGDRDPWIELANDGSLPVTLDGWYLSDRYTALARWPFPTGAQLAGREFKWIWADAETGETAGTNWHTNFRLTAPAGVVVLSRLQQGQPAVVDYLEYTGLGADQSFGYLAPRVEDSEPILFAEATPGAPNGLSPAPPPYLTQVDVSFAGFVTLRWTAVAGWTYRVEAASALTAEPWRFVGQLTATSPEAALTDSVLAEGPGQYYRVVLLP